MTADGTSVYGSKCQAIVPLTDADFVAWAADGTPYTLWPKDETGAQTDAALQAVLAPYGLYMSLAPLQADLKARVDTAAEALRLTLITPGSGQAMEYQEAYAEAVQVDQATKAGQAVDAAAFPMLSASLGYDLDPTTGKPTTDIPGEARAVLAAYDAYQKAGAAIRSVRLKGKAAIDAAADAAGAQAAFAAIVWPTLA
jgi:hypothetical protein